MGHIIWTLDEVKKAIPDQDTFWLSDCACRKEKGNTCKKGVRMCLGFSEKATSTPNNRGPITRAKMKELLEFAKTEHLVPRPFIGDNGKVTSVCLCCPCCCDYILGKPGETNVAGPSVEATDKAACVSCEACVDLCYFGARKVVDGTLTIDRSKCYGCGVCVDSCGPGAISMKPR
jgi:Pyruvate/2-oxoacid:ferredoxin oxidoreductase delta subunit